MKTITILVTGLLQPERRSNGPAVAEVRILKADPTADVRRYKWSQWNEIATIAAGLAAEYKKAKGQLRIVLAGHSFGCWFACKLALALKGLGVPVFAIVSADGVNRPPSGQLRIPSNVEFLWAWWNRMPPRLPGLPVIHGSELKWNPETTVVVNEEVKVYHAQVDEQKAWQDTVFKLATGKAA